MPKDKKDNKGLGRSLMKKKGNKKKELPEAKFQHMDDVDDEKMLAETKLKSIIDQNNLSEFLQTAELQARQFEASRDVKVTKKTLENDKKVVIDMNNLSTVKKKAYDVQLNEYLKNLRIPRRPKWDKKMSASELAQKENDNFLNWRRELAKVEETHYELTLTPYERNVEVWKQLWRVMEKSDIVIQIVDGRDPLFFRCVDLEIYSKELDEHKQNILLINKADLLSQEIREHWSEYFNRLAINHIFFSAKKEQEKIDKDEKGEDRAEPQKYQNTAVIVSRTELLTTLKSIVLQIREYKQSKTQVKETNLAEDENENPLAEKRDENIVTLGMVGYPNVGKSSVINVLCQKKLVGVAAQPGKTKHFQTHFIEKDLLLCDCPGLVFPSASSTRAEMVCNGVLPIDTIKDYISPIDLICQRVETRVLERLYKLKIDVLITSGSQFLQFFARARGHFTGSGLPDQAKTAKKVLKDLVNGKLLMCKLSPDYNPETMPKINTSNQYFNDDELQDEKKIKLGNETTAEEKKTNGEAEIPAMKEKKEIKNENDDKEEELEEEFFDQGELGNDIEEDFCEEEIFDLLEGKKVRGIKLNKSKRREIKFALKRGEMPSLKGILSTLNKSDAVPKPGMKGKHAVGLN